MSEQKTTNFFSGITNEPRSTIPSVFWYSENLEVGVRKSLKQVVNNQAENSCSYATANNITKLIQVGTQIYGLGQDNATNKDTTIWTKTNALNGNWSIATNGTISSTTFNSDNPLFVANNGIIYLDGGNSKVAKYTIATNTMSATAINLANAKGGVMVSYSDTVSPSVTFDSGTYSTGAFTTSLTGLTANTDYRVAAFATNPVGTSYGSTVSFTTLSVNTGNFFQMF